MSSRDKLFTRSREGYFGTYCPRCCATREINIKITLSWARKQFASRDHTLFYMYPPPEKYINRLWSTIHKSDGDVLRPHWMKMSEWWCDAMGPIDTARLPDEPCMSLINNKYGSSVMHSPRKQHGATQTLFCNEPFSVESFFSLNRTHPLTV